MPARQTWFWAAALVLHLFLISAASLQDISASLAGGAGLLPVSCDKILTRIQSAAAAIVGKDRAEPAALRRSLAVYTDCTGIEVGYSYFAPNVSANSRLEFEVHYADGRVQYDVPPVGGAATGYRLSILLDHLQRIRYVPLREAILKNLVSTVRRDHPGAQRIRARLTIADLPSLAAYRAGQRISYRSLYAYDFKFLHRPIQPAAE